MKCHLRKATSDNFDFCYERSIAAAGCVSEVRRISSNTTRFRSLAIHPQILVLATKPVVRGGRSGFTIIEVVASLFILSLAVVACVALFQTRRSGMDATSAMNAAPAAIDALQVALDAEGPDELAKALAGGTARRIAFVDAEARMWRVLKTDAALPAPDGPVFVATLSSPLAQGGGRALEFDVELGWVRPWYSGATQTDVLAALASPNALCAYRCIVLKEGLVE